MKLYDVGVAGIRNQHQRLMKCLLGIVLYSERFVCIFISVEQILFTDKKTRTGWWTWDLIQVSQHSSSVCPNIFIYKSNSPTQVHFFLATLEILFFSPPSSVFFPFTGLFLLAYKHTKSLLLKQKYRSKTNKTLFYFRFSSSYCSISFLVLSAKLIINCIQSLSPFC